MTDESSDDIGINKRRRKIVFIVILAGVLGISSFLGFYFKSGGGDSISVDFSANILKASEILAQNFYIEQYVVKEGDTWSVISENMRIGGTEAANIFDASHEVYDLVSVRAGNDFRFFFDKVDGELGRIEYDIDKDTFLLILRGDLGQFTASVKAIRYEVEEVITSGVITSSLFETAQEQGLSANVILNFAHILSWDIDFASSVQAGDSFAVVYEKRWRDGKPAKPGKILAVRFTNNGNISYAFRYTNPNGVSDYYSEGGRELRRQFLKSPLDYSRITSGFSYSRFHPILQTFSAHQAIDYAAATGTPVSVTGNGTVTYAGWNGGYGRYIKVRNGGGYSTVYAHLSVIAKGTYVGARVRQNDVIGFVGSTGLSTGPHLHYEMHFNGIKINPLSVDLPPGEVMKGEYLEDFYKVRDILKKKLAKE